ncbi:MAG: nicotinamide mononucleotide transporter [Leptospiraceae bacterium]|nr:nicotinamide mononucleotide transporter [Leptospiraceae bacterium]
MADLTISQLAEIVAFLAGFLCVWWTIRENILCWPAGLVQVCLYVWIFFEAKLYSDVGLHIFYIFLQFYGWYHWLYGGADQENLSISRLGGQIFAAWIGIGVAGSIVWGYVMHRYTDAAVPYWDAYTTVASLIAQWLLTRKNLESWYFWISVDIVAIGVYLYKGLYLTSGLYMAFLIMATGGLLRWRKVLLRDRPGLEILPQE